MKDLEICEKTIGVVFRMFGPSPKSAASVVSLTILDRLDD